MHLLYFSFVMASQMSCINEMRPFRHNISAGIIMQASKASHTMLSQIFKLSRYHWRQQKKFHIN